MMTTMNKDKEKVTMATHCEMSDECNGVVTHVGDKGYVYCESHAVARRYWERTRRMRPWEVRWIEQGRPLPSYKTGPEPKE